LGISARLEAIRESYGFRVNINHDAQGAGFLIAGFFEPFKKVVEYILNATTYFNYYSHLIEETSKS